MTEIRTLPGQIAHLATERPDRMALCELGADGNWVSTTWSEYWQAVRDLANGLIALGMEQGQAVAFIGNNRVDWVISQMGISAGTGVPAPIYVTNTIDQIAYIVNHCAAKIVICDNQEQLTKLTTAMDRGLISPNHIITMDPLDSDRENVMSLADLSEKGRSQPNNELERRMAAAEPDDLALLIYTSGTTGVPKGARCTHRGIDAAAASFIEVTPQCLEIDPYRYLSYLPLCHVAEQAFTNFIALKSANETYFCADLSKVGEHLQIVRPHSFFAVPRVWEKFEAAISQKFTTATGLKAKLLSWARRVELDCAKRSMSSGKVVNTLQRRLANSLVLSKIRASIGLDQAFIVGSGAAPTADSTLEFFASLGILIHEGFGMTETYGVAMKQPNGFPRFGTVGVALPGMEVRIAQDGEIMLRGTGLITGYQNMPDESAELFDQDRWMSTGDLGTLDPEGYLTITGRKKDLLITAGGKNIAPAEMENHLQSIPWISQAVVVGDRQPYLCALLAIDDEALPAVCQAAGVQILAREEMAANPKLRSLLADHIESHCNSKVARYQTIKKFEIFPRMLSVEGDELTPTLKIKRNIINDKYRALIDGMYGNSARA
jgi:long-chain acyl-CoA synthetase